MTPPEKLEYLKDDRLFTPEIRPWTVEKYRVVGILNKIFSAGMKDKWGCRTYIDLFAGAGRGKVKGTNKILAGSPLLALGVPDQYDKYIFCEKDKKRLDALKDRVNRVKESNPNVNVTFFDGDCNEKIDEILSAIPKMQSVLSFCFLDPYNIGIHFETVRQLSHHRMDFLILLAIEMDAARNIKYHERISLCLGDDNWMEEWEEAERSGERFPNYFANKYASQMMTLGYLDTSRETMHPVRSDKNNLPLYHLAFFSKHPRGYDFWNKARQYGIEQQSLF
ncbi:MAG: three-Cys-motif partner protein TcmP [bacterium]|nr:three-Cys-motif partner protein TcmP [bacterium]